MMGRGASEDEEFLERWRQQCGGWRFQKRERYSIGDIVLVLGGLDALMRVDLWVIGCH